MIFKSDSRIIAERQVNEQRPKFLLMLDQVGFTQTIQIFKNHLMDQGSQMFQLLNHLSLVKHLDRVIRLDLLYNLRVLFNEIFQNFLTQRE